MMTPTAPKGRVLVAKPGLDGHDRGAKVIARALRDAGYEVIYTGIRQTPEMIAEAALQEDVDAIGLSILSGAHMTLFPRIVGELRKRGLDDVIVWAGGIIPEEDIRAIKAMGITEVFGPGSPMGATIEFLDRALAERRVKASHGPLESPPRPVTPAEHSVALQSARISWRRDRSP